MEEIWKDIEGYEGLYQVSNIGRVKSVRKNIILKSQIARSGYKRIQLYKNNKGYKHFQIHRLVAHAFIPNPDNLPQVNHKDENKTNNCVDNLEWCDGKYNINYGTGNKRRGLSNTNGKCSKPVLQYSLDGTFIKEWKSTMDVERNLGFAHTHISECCRGEQSYAYSYIWKYNINYGTGNKKRALSNTNGKLSKPVCQYSKDGCFIKEWESIMDVERMTGYSGGHISECCRNIRKSAYSYIWRYKKEID